VKTFLSCLLACANDGFSCCDNVPADKPLTWHLLWKTADLGALRVGNLLCLPVVKLFLEAVG
jgi:hypothetical protein